MVEIESRKERITGERKGNKKNRKQDIANKLDGTVAVVISLLSLILIVGRLFIFTPYQVSGLSMSPTLGDGDKVVVTEDSEYNRGDIIVFNSPVSEGDTYVKRVVGIEGDTVTIKDGGVEVNGKMLTNQEEFGNTDAFRDTGVSETLVPSGHLYVLGDNRENSMDSRIFGTIKESSVRGKMVCRFLPITDFHCGV